MQCVFFMSYCADLFKLHVSCLSCPEVWCMSCQLPTWAPLEAQFTARDIDKLKWLDRDFFWGSCCYICTGKTAAIDFLCSSAGEWTFCPSLPGRGVRDKALWAPFPSLLLIHLPSCLPHIFTSWHWSILSSKSKQEPLSGFDRNHQWDFFYLFIYLVMGR